MNQDSTTYDAVIVGTGFAASFFLHGWLRRAAPGARVLVLDAGPRRGREEQLRDGLQRDRERFLAEARRHYANRTPEKTWVVSVGFGGGSNCWWGNTPRMLPADFRLRSAYGVGADWPFDYDALEPYYCDAEEIMGISGPEGAGPAPRSRPYPQPPHRLSDPDRRIAAAFPDAFFPIATARARRPTARRPGCCASSACSLCPVDAKFTIVTELAWVYDDPRVTLRSGARVVAVDTRGGVATGVRHTADGREQVARGDLVVLGANALFNPAILLASGLGEGGVGEGLVEQVSRTVRVDLDGLDNFQGSTSHTGHGYMFYDGGHRRTRAAALVETSNVPQLRRERGRWRQFLSLKYICEDLRQPANRVELDADGRPATTFVAHSDYAARGLDAAAADCDRLLATLPVQRIEVGEPNEGEAHVMGTTVMGADPRTSVVDGDCVHHRLRNLLVLGSGTFPTAAPANPTLTIAAQALRAAARLRDEALSA